MENKNPIETTLYPLGNQRYLISIDDKANLYEISFYKGSNKKAHERAIFLLKQIIKKCCKITDKEIEKYFREKQ